MTFELTQIWDDQDKCLDCTLGCIKIYVASVMGHSLAHNVALIVGGDSCLTPPLKVSNRQTGILINTYNKCQGDRNVILSPQTIFSLPLRGFNMSVQQVFRLELRI